MSKRIYRIVERGVEFRIAVNIGGNLVISDKVTGCRIESDRLPASRRWYVDRRPEYRPIVNDEDGNMLICMGYRDSWVLTEGETGLAVADNERSITALVKDAAEKIERHGRRSFFARLGAMKRRYGTVEDQA